MSQNELEPKQSGLLGSSVGFVGKSEESNTATTPSSTTSPNTKEEEGDWRKKHEESTQAAEGREEKQNESMRGEEHQEEDPELVEKPRKRTAKPDLPALHEKSGGSAKRFKKEDQKFEGWKLTYPKKSLITFAGNCCFDALYKDKEKCTIHDDGSSETRTKLCAKCTAFNIQHTDTFRSFYVPPKQQKD